MLVGVLALLFLFCLRQRKKATGRQPLDDEKSTSAGDTSTSVAAFAEDRVPSLRSVRTASTAPRLSLRPVTQFQPNLTSNRNTGIALSPVSQLTTTSHSAEEAFSQSAVERPTSSESQNKTDPFGIHADPIDSANVAESPIIGVGPGGIIAAATSPETDVPDAEVEGAATAIGVATTIEDSTAASAGLARSASKLGHGPKPLDLTKKPSSPELPSPAVSDFSMSSDALGSSVPTPGAAAIAAAGGPPNSTVHRVQLDFSPSMDDELPLRSGQLVRLLHEYDDGWVSNISRHMLFRTNIGRLSASVSIAQRKVLFLVPAFQCVLSSRVCINPVSVHLPFFDRVLHRIRAIQHPKFRVWVSAPHLQLAAVHLWEDQVRRTMLNQVAP